MLSHTNPRIINLHTALSRNVVGKNVHATIPKGNMGYDQYTVPDDCSCRTYFCCFPLALTNTFPWPFVPILSNYFEKKRTQNHPQCLSGLSRALFQTTFLEIAVYSPRINNMIKRISLRQNKSTQIDCSSLCCNKTNNWSCGLISLTEVWFTIRTIHFSLVRHDCQNNFPLEEKLLHT